MSKKSTIDHLFKSQLTEIPVAKKEQLWDLLEEKLNAEKKGSGFKKRYLLFLLLMLGAATTFLLLTNNSGKQLDGNIASTDATKNKITSTNPNTTPTKQANPTVAQTTISTTNSNAANSYGNNNFQIGASKTDGDSQNGSGQFLASTSSRKHSKKPIIENGQQRVNIQSAQTESEEESTDKISTISVVKNAETTVVVPEFVSTDQKPSEQEKTKLTENISANKKEKTLTTEDKKSNDKKEIASRKVNVAVAAGMDIFLKAKETGYYGGLQVTVPVNKKVNLVTGLQLSKHKMQENYSNAEKQLANPDKSIDAKLEGITVVQMPVLYELSLPNNKVKFRAGLTPTYIVDAGIYNVPSSFTGSVANYRKFSLEDLHRLNVLFTAGIGVSVTKNIELELKGNYGLTELVKNSYINQSSVNNNFRSAQVGIIYTPKKKKK